MSRKVFAGRWVISALLAASSIALMLYYAISDAAILGMWESFTVQSSVAWMMLWPSIPLFLAVMIAPVASVPARVIIVAVAFMLTGVQHTLSDNMKGFNRAANFKVAAIEKTEDHFFLEEINDAFRSGNAGWLADKRGYLWGHPLKSESLIQLRVWASMLNPRSESVQYLNRWLNSGFVPSGMYPELIERLGNDALAFENVDLSGDQIALLLRN